MSEILGPPEQYGIKLGRRMRQIWMGDCPPEDDSCPDEFRRVSYVYGWLQGYGQPDLAVKLSLGEVVLPGASNQKEPSSRDVGLPSLPRLAARFAHAQAQWRLEGKPLREESEFLEITEEICPNCPGKWNFIDKNGDLRCGHPACGCRPKDHVTYLGIVVPGKARMATQRCPIMAWPGEEYYKKEIPPELISKELPANG